MNIISIEITNTVEVAKSPINPSVRTYYNPNLEFKLTGTMDEDEYRQLKDSDFKTITVGSDPKKYQAGMLTAVDYIKTKTPAEKVANIFNTDNDDTWFISEDAPEIVIRVDNDYFLMTDDFKIIQLIPKQ